MRDIQDREDIEFLVNTFYDQVKKDKIIGFFFTQIADLDFDSHLPKMYEFWESIIFKKASYSGNPMLSHIQLDRKSSIKPFHFKQWLALWEDTLNKNFSGKNTDEAIERAKQIAQLIQFKIK